jgi:alpha-galactosidase
MKCLQALLYVLVVTAATAAAAQEESAHWKFAETPPMGWNSWDIFGTTVTEEQVKQQADAMAERLLPAGYDVLTVDIQWYEPNSRGHGYRRGAELTMDEFGRLTPAVNKFPSAAGSQGFKPLGDFLHAKGLRFGIHIMRGIARQAVERNTPILGTDAKAQDIALTSSTCPWNPDMFGVDATKPAGQAYYDSLFAMYADWGVDYVKVDDIARPYNDVLRAEIEAIRQAIDKTGRPMVLSLSPGATPIAAGEHVIRHANLWRITDDFWDRWPLLFAMFERLDAWTPYRRPGAWPDADMLPLGFVEFGRATRFTPDEQTTLMTLWSIGLSPLIFGGDMTKLDERTMALLTNPEVLELNQTSSNNRQLSRENNLIVWAADAPGSDDKYVALFNAQSMGDSIDVSRAAFTSPPMTEQWASHDVEVSLAGAKRLALFVRDNGDGHAFDHFAWIKPTLHGPNGDLSLTTLKWKYADAGWGEARVNRTVDNRPLEINGKRSEGIGAHANSTIVFELPDGYESLTVTGALTNRGSVTFGVLTEQESDESGESTDVAVSLASLGISGKAKVRDLWAGKDLGVVEERLVRDIPSHGAGLYRLTPVMD